jgi:hypothetical protein
MTTFYLRPNKEAPTETMIHFQAHGGAFQATMILEAIPVLTLFKIRKLFKLILSDPQRNAEAIQAITSYLPREATEARDVWHKASKDYQNNYRATYLNGSAIPEARQKKINRPLILAVKKAKANFERTQKIQFIFQEIQNKEK